ncbi:Hpt domain-containing protein [Chitinophaga solisilvae]|uniref:Hpt domain-containing protein n=1 Tax=Chitinophaga solisilvae TaxID=1233460 RepID=A0A433WG18_9BACT|nr:Hpt domain-containing protein [Chitinophaga solisilvae]NSL87362.1 Hpt domain-containing protein [Chitinophaga solisilvae]
MENPKSTPFLFLNKDLDIAFLQQLYKDEPLYAFDMFEGFMQEIGQRMADLSAAVTAGDWKKTQYHVHQIKSFIGIVGLTKVQDKAQQLESCCSSGNREMILLLFREINLAVRKSMTPVKQELERLREFLYPQA